MGAAILFTQRLLGQGLSMKSLGNARKHIGWGLLRAEFSRARALRRSGNAHVRGGGGVPLRVRTKTVLGVGGNTRLSRANRTLERGATPAHTAFRRPGVAALL